MSWLARIFRRRAFTVSIDETHATFLYRERGRRIRVSGEAMADGYAIYAASISAWENVADATIDDAERQRIAANICSYLTDRGNSVYLA